MGTLDCHKHRGTPTGLSHAPQQQKHQEPDHNIHAGSVKTTVAERTIIEFGKAAVATDYTTATASPLQAKIGAAPQVMC